MKRFRIKERDTVSASVINRDSGKLLAQLYDSGFSTISGVKYALLRKIPYTSAKKVTIHVVNQSEETSKTFSVSINR